MRNPGIFGSQIRYHQTDLTNEVLNSCYSYNSFIDAIEKPMPTLQIIVPESHYKSINDFLKTIPSVEVSEGTDRSIIPSSAQAGEKPSDHAGPWKKDKRDFQEIRRKAWTRKR